MFAWSTINNTAVDGARIKLDSIFLRAVVFGAFQLFIFYFLFDVQALWLIHLRGGLNAMERGYVAWIGGSMGSLTCQNNFWLTKEQLEQRLF
jgi:hypothetical protein